MEQLGPVRSEFGIENNGIFNANRVYWNLSQSRLLEEAVRRGEGILSADGALVVTTGKHTGRSPNDKFIVKEKGSADKIDWGKVNRPIEPEAFDRLHARVLAYLQNRDLFVQDTVVGAMHGIPVRVITPSAWHSLFARTMLLRPSTDERKKMVPEFTVLHAPHFKATPELDGTASETFIIVSYEKKVVLIGGSE